MAYGVKYSSSFKDFFGADCRIDILKNGYSGAVNQFTCGSDPVVITYKNENETKFNPISESYAEINFIASHTLSLSDFYTEDEREYLVKIYRGASMIWAGFVVPDDSHEPFLYPPYEARLKATDTIATLKGISYTAEGGVLIKKIASFKDVLIDCLKYTGLELDLILGVNIIADGTPGIEPLSEVFIDTNRFIDGNGKALSVYEVIKAIAMQFTATFKQVNGAFWLVNIAELGTSNNTNIYNKAGALIGTTKINPGLKQVGKSKSIKLVNKDHDLSLEKAYKSVSTYFQYGYLPNKIPNGDFNEINPIPAVGFKNWTAIGNLTFLTGYAAVRNIDWQRNPNYDPNIPRTDTDANPGTGSNPFQTRQPINDYYLSFKHSAKDGSGLRSSPVIIKDTDSSMNLRMKMIPEFPYNTDIYLTVKFEDKYLNGNTWTTKPTFTRVMLRQSANWETIDIPIPTTGVNGYLTVEFNYVDGTPNLNHVAIDDVSLSVQEDKYTKAVKGKVHTLTQVGNFSHSPDAHVILFGDSTNRFRTEWIRMADSTPTSTWSRKGKSDGFPLQHILTKNILNNYYRVTKIFEGTLLGQSLSAFNTFKIDLIEGSNFFISSGSFNIKRSTANVTLMEYMSIDVVASESSYDDTGDFKNSSGNSVGTTGGIGNVGVPPSGLQRVPNLQEVTDEGSKTDKIIETGGLIVSPDGPLVIPSSFDPNKVPVGRVAMYWSDTEPGQSGTPPPIITRLVDLADVNIAGLADGHILYYNQAAGKFQFKANNPVVDLSNYWTKGEADGRFLGINGTAINSTKWGEQSFTGGIDSGFNYIIGSDGTGVWQAKTAGAVKSFLGLGSAAYLNADTGPSANSVVKRTADGYVFANYFNTVAGVEPSNMTDFAGFSYDGYIRRFAASAARVALGMPSGGDTLQSVTDRYNVTTTPIAFNRGDGSVVGGIGWNSGEFYIGGHPLYGSGAGNDVKIRGFGGDLLLGTSGIDVIRIDYAGNLYSNTWLRISGQKGIFWQDYLGGLYMEDSTFIRTYNGKKFYCDNEIQSRAITANQLLSIPSTAPDPADMEVGKIYMYATGF